MYARCIYSHLGGNALQSNPLIMYMSKKSTAIKTLNQHLLDLENVANVQQGNTWKASLRDLLGIYVGPDSAILNRLDNLYFTRKESYVPDGNIIGIFYRHIYEDSKKESFRHLIRNAISHVESNGLHVNRISSNFLSGFNNAQIIGAIVVAAGTIYGIGNYLGKFEKEREIIQLGKTIDSKDSYINELEDGQNAELRTLNIENTNLKTTYEKVYKENEGLKSENDRLANENRKLKKGR